MINRTARSGTRWGRVGLGTVMGVLLFLSGAPSRAEARARTATLASPLGVCRAPESGAPSEPTGMDTHSTGTEYYEFALVTTRNVPGTGRSSGLGQVTFTPSPFVVSIGDDGSYNYDLSISGLNLRPPREGVFVAWAMTPELDEILRLGALDDEMTVWGQVGWNKFLAAITLETEDDPDAAEWSGPIVMRGISRSGLMHTMAGHGPFQKDLCATYGFGN